MRQNQQRRLGTTMMILVVLCCCCLGAKLWVRDAHSFLFHPISHRRIASFNNDFCRSTPVDANIYRHKRRLHGIADTLATFESGIEIEIEATIKAAAPAAFDYRKIPPISDTTPCEVVQVFSWDKSRTTDNVTIDGDIFSNGKEEEEFYFPSLEELASLPKGDRGGYHIVRQYTVVGNMNMDLTAPITNSNSNANSTLQYALTVLDSGNYPTLTRARKACRKGMVLVRHGSNKRVHIDGQGLVNQDNSGKNGSSSGSSNDGSIQFGRGNVGDLVAPGDIIGIQMFLGTYRKKQCYPNIEYSRPQFQLPVLYEDDHLAVVNKPAGIAVYSETRNGGGETGSSKTKIGNRRTVHFALPFALTPPKKGTTGGILRRPGIVHRIDKPTSGLLLVAKTKAAMESLYEQFRNRDIQKIYTAIVNGDVMDHQDEYQQWKQAEEKEFEWQHRDTRDKDLDTWNLIDYPLGGKHALTSWKIRKRARSLNAKDGVLTMVQVRLHTGRYHQIRRHFAWWCRRPLVGDHLYAGLLQAHHFRKKGLFLCSNGISFLHPIPLQRTNGDDDNEEAKNCEPRRVEVVIDIPKRFDKLMKAEESWSIHKWKEKI